MKLELGGFQFQTGSIKSETKDGDVIFDDKFQFQTGSIKSYVFHEGNEPFE